jgi:hypothetical protein
VVETHGAVPGPEDGDAVISHFETIGTKRDEAKTGMKGFPALGTCTVGGSGTECLGSTVLREGRLLVSVRPRD